MKLLLSILTSVVFTTYLMANNSIVVNTTQDLVNAVSTVKPGDTILIADGTYKNLRLSVTTDVFQGRQQKFWRMEDSRSGNRQHICRPLRGVRMSVL